jgi:hypothetical protein
MELNLAKRLSRRAIPLGGAVVMLLGVTGVVWFEKERKVTTHLTIYVDPVVAREGGMIIISALPLAQTEWNKLPDTDTTAMWDKTNGKHQQVAVGDKHFGVVVTSKAAAVEVFYPADGTYTFNFLKYPTDTSSTSLITERLEVGSGSALPDPATGKSMDWPSESLIAISGTEHGPSWVRMVDDRFLDLSGPEGFKYYSIMLYSGGRLIELTQAGLEKIVGGVSSE